MTQYVCPLCGMGGAGQESSYYVCHKCHQAVMVPPDKLETVKRNLLYGYESGAVVFCDSAEDTILPGDVVRMTEGVNKDSHGDWVDCDVVFRGPVLALLYRESAKGQVLPRGYTGSALADHYDPKEYMFCAPGRRVVPFDIELKIQKEYRK